MYEKKKPDIAKIALELEINCGQMGGELFGCNPKYIASYFKAHKIKYSKYTTLKKFKSNISKGNIFILSFWNENYGSTSINTYTSGLHTVMVKCLSENHFRVYNDGNYDTTYTTYFSFAELLEGKRFSCVYKIK